MSRYRRKAWREVNGITHSECERNGMRWSIYCRTFFVLLTLKTWFSKIARSMTGLCTLPWTRNIHWHSLLSQIHGKWKQIRLWKFSCRRLWAGSLDDGESLIMWGNQFSEEMKWKFWVENCPWSLIIQLAVLIDLLDRSLISQFDPITKFFMLDEIIESVCVTTHCNLLVNLIVGNCAAEEQTSLLRMTTWDASLLKCQVNREKETKICKMRSLFGKRIKVVRSEKLKVRKAQLTDTVTNR